MRQSHDPYAVRARRTGYRSRAAFKLQEIDARDHILRPGAVVVDLGASPGGWSQVAVERVGPKGTVIAVDRQPMEAIPGVQILQADFATEMGLAQLEATVSRGPVDVVLSDMSPDLSGIKVVDQAHALELGELAARFAASVLHSNGVLLVKVFQGAGFEDLKRSLRSEYRFVAGRQPAASRKGSAEQYLLARGLCRN